MPTTEPVEFTGVTGATLSGVLTRPDGTARGAVLLVHCFTCGKDLHTMTRLARGLAERGLASFRFDFTGLGESGGEFTDVTVGSDVRDIGRAAMTLIQMGFGPCGMLGHSLGGAASLLAAERLKTVRSMVVLGAPSTVGHIRHLLGDAAPAPGEPVTAWIAGRPFPITHAFLDDLDAHDALEAAAGLDRPLMVVHSPDDEVVGVAEGEAIFAAARQPKAFMPLVGADHLVSDRRVAERLVDVVGDWFLATL